MRFSKKLLFIPPIIVITVVMASLYHHRQAEWQPVKVGPMVQAVYGLGTVTAEHVYNMKVTVGKDLNEILVHEGQQVAKGQALLSYGDHLFMRAPFDGTVTAIPSNSHEVVNSQDTILSLVNLQSRYMVISLDQDSILQIKPGMTARFNFETMPDTYTSKVRFIYPNQGSFYVRLNLKDLPDNILPGMTADVAIITQQFKQALQIPKKAINNQQQVTYEDNGHKQTVTVKVGATNDQWAQILSPKIPRTARVLVS